MVFCYIMKGGSFIITITKKEVTMARAPYQVLIIPFMIENDISKYAIFKKKIWEYGNLSQVAEKKEKHL